jgi:hypothetical protein
LQPVHVNGAAHLIGQLRAVRIVEVLPNSLRGVLAESTGAAAQRATAH